MFCRNSSINISIDNRYYNRFIHLGKLIFTVNHNGACVYNPDHTWDRACVCYTRDAPLTQSVTWVSDHRYSTARFSHYFVSPLHLQSLYLLLIPPACWYKLNCNRFNDHERLFFLAATNQLYEWYFLSVCLSVCPSVCLSVRHTFLTMFPSSYHHQIFRNYHHGTG